MKKESRFNLVFLLAFLAISLPGAFILFRAKLQPEARIMYNPPAVRKTLAYMVPHETSGDMIRTVPGEVVNWVDSVSQSRFGTPASRPVAPGGRPDYLLSTDRRFEFLGLQQTSEGYLLHLLCWLPGDEDLETLSVVSPGWDVTAIDVDELSIPETIRETLREHGYTNPPKECAVVEISLENGNAGESCPSTVLLGDDRAKLKFPKNALTPNKPQVRDQ